MSLDIKCDVCGESFDLNHGIMRGKGVVKFPIRKDHHITTRVVVTITAVSEDGIEKDYCGPCFIDKMREYL